MSFRATSFHTNSKRDCPKTRKAKSYLAKFYASAEGSFFMYSTQNSDIGV